VERVVREIGVACCAILCHPVPMGFKEDQVKALRINRANKSRGGVEGHAGRLASVAVVHPASAALPSDGCNSSGKTGPRPRSTAKPVEVAGIKASPREFKKPLAKDADKSLSRTKPWEAEGMSRRTWYRRRKAEKREGSK
jgi:hypothetical protein